MSRFKIGDKIRWRGGDYWRGTVIELLPNDEMVIVSPPSWPYHEWIVPEKDYEIWEEVKDDEGDKNQA